MFYLLGSAVARVGIALDDKCAAARAIGLIGNLLHLGAIARGFVNCALDIVGWHVGCLGLLDSCSYAG